MFVSACDTQVKLMSMMLATYDQWFVAALQLYAAGTCLLLVWCTCGRIMCPRAVMVTAAAGAERQEHAAACSGQTAA
jgi:enoyl-CoA hydratase/carnithine racemase